MAARHPWAAMLLAAALVNAPPLAAQSPARTVIRVGTLAPDGTSAHRALSAWADTLAAQTRGRLRIELETSHDEATLLARLRGGHVDAATLGSASLATICPPALVLRAPGVADDDAQFDLARVGLDAALRAELSARGMELLGWGEAGEERVFSAHRIASPADVAAGLPLQRPGDVVLDELLVQAHAHAVPMGAAGVLPALASGRIDVVIAPATAVRTLRWSLHLGHVLTGTRGVMAGATLMTAARYVAIPSGDRAVLDSTAVQAHTLLRRDVRRADASNYRSMLGTGLIETPPASAAWDALAQQTRHALIGSLYSQTLLTQAWTAAGHAGAP